ncbi:TraB/GumN family protein [Wenzhouxiangella sp. AB-CW3]|uniref:TraB/GumN family protein n=1 Tax=Wenzhouxiangella sp. AB-CW3 TaxID=2771012 RepID=UPI00168B0134|nr:TraB/GumN family protein [Wenzhouxiangella sp. AB-CW3]QOC21503.1 TraB/GumN family protein [Wenzhouxiangella sp. AB-CW3]
MSLVRLVLPGLLLLSSALQAQVFWSVTDDEGRQNWLLGTVHSEDPRLLDFPPELIEALGASGYLALELVPDATMLEQLQRAMHFDEGGLDEVLEPELYDEVVRILAESYGMGEPAVRRLRPWAVGMTLSVPPPETGIFMDLALSFRAGGMGVEVIALETIDEQLGFLKGMSKEAQIKLVRAAVAEHDIMDEMLDALIRAYLDGDLDRLESLSMDQMEGMDEEFVSHFNEIGLRQRNHTMVKRAQPYLEGGGLFIAVGALHLPGEDGLIKLLRDKGYRLEAVY